MIGGEYPPSLLYFMKGRRQLNPQHTLDESVVNHKDEIALVHIFGRTIWDVEEDSEDSDYIPPMRRHPSARIESLEEKIKRLIEEKESKIPSFLTLNLYPPPRPPKSFSLDILVPIEFPFSLDRKKSDNKELEDDKKRKVKQEFSFGKFKLLS